MPPLAIVASLLSLATAQTVVTLFPDNYGLTDHTESYNASVVAAAPTATTYSLGCHVEAVDGNCTEWPQVTVVTASTWYSYDVTETAFNFTHTQTCELRQSSYTCKISAGGEVADEPGSRTETYPATDIGLWLLTITAGANKLTAGSAGATVTPALSGDKPSATLAESTAAPEISGSGGAAKPTESTGAAAARGVELGGRLVGAAVGFFGMRLL